MPKDDLFSQLMPQKYKQKDDDDEDPIPYDENSGTMSNIGRFMANNVAKDKGYGNMFPMVGAAKPIVEAVEAAIPEATNALKTAATEAASKAISGFQDISKQMPSSGGHLQKAKSWIDKYKNATLSDPEDAKSFYQDLSDLKDKYSQSGGGGPTNEQMIAAKNKAFPEQSQLADYQRGVADLNKQVRDGKRYQYLKSTLKEGK